MAPLRTLAPLVRLATRPSRSSLPSFLPSTRATLPHSARLFSLSARLREQQQPPQHTLNGPKTPIGQIDPLDRRLQITFTCTAPVPVVAPPPGEPVPEDAEARECGERSTHEFSRRSYEKGVVLVQCPGCNNRHLIADHLQWFSQTPSTAHPQGQPIGGETPRTVEHLMREKGEEVKWGEQKEPAVAYVMRERQEGDGGKTVEILGEATQEDLQKYEEAKTEGEAEEVKRIE
ncbi:hypothetical protein JCM8097_004973 [Rhodosporidiobolus ruineniae]